MSLRMRNPPEKSLFCRKLPFHKKGIQQRNGISLGILLALGRWFRQVTSKCVNSPPTGNNFRISNSNSFLLWMSILKKIQYKIVISIKINLTQPNFISIYWRYRGFGCADPGIVQYGGFSTNTDLTGLNQRYWAGNSWRNHIPPMDSPFMSW
jgi:hypothetical protein